LLVASPPDLLFVRDADGDGVADERTVLLSGFAAANEQHNFNGLTWGIDNWIYGANGGNSGEVYGPDRAQEPLPLRFDDFRVDLEGRRLQRWGRSSGGFEITFDSWGRNFGTHNLFHISHLVFPGSHVRHLPEARSTRERISDHGGDGPARIYPIGVQATRVNHPQQSGHFSGACGITAYTGGAFPEEFADNVFVADVVTNLIHRSVISEAGTSLVASRARPGEEFLASTDRAFRPVNMTVGPDGALYVLDMHREVIEHPEWIPDPMEEGMDLQAGRAQGRIYRIVAKGALGEPSPVLDRADAAGLGRALSHPNGWVRLTAQRLLIEEGAVEAVAGLRSSVLSSDSPVHRLHALWSLEGLVSLDDETLLGALEDRHARVREAAVLLAQTRLVANAELAEVALGLVSDADDRVRLRLALALGARHAEPDVAKILDIADWAPEDEWTRLAVTSVLADRVVPALRDWLPRSIARSRGGRVLAQDLAALAGADDLQPVLDAVTSTPAGYEPLPAVLSGLAAAAERLQGLPRIDSATVRWVGEIAGEEPGELAVAALRLSRSLALELSPSQREIVRRALDSAKDGRLDAWVRLAALETASFAPSNSRREVLLDLLGVSHPGAVQMEALRQLTVLRDPRVGAAILDRWRGLSPGVRDSASSYFLRNRDHHGLLLSALEEGRVSLGEMNLRLERRRALLRSDDPDIRRRAEAFFDDAGVVTRGEALARLAPALDLPGRAAAGGRLFGELCERCHRFGGKGNDVGPDLTEISRKSPETLLHDIVDPNAGVETEFLSYTVETHDGRLLSGLLRDETDAGLVIVKGDGTRTPIARSGIAAVRTGGLSLMPEELEAGRSPQDMADLLAFLLTGGGI
ncbi:MAG: PVC-type heme-binding CxxCH protein, partial [Acidobacteriota bacterium]|nr:PVC-type heme-binding CxxCH protein [Acidobacteriota bacterium]